MKLRKENIIFGVIVVIFVALLIVMSKPEGKTDVSSDFLDLYTGNNEMSIDEISSNSRLECEWFKDCPVLDDVVIEIGDYGSVQITHPDIEIEKIQSNMYDVVGSMLTEHINLSKYIAENYEGCKDEPVKVAFNYKVNGLEVKYVNSTSDFDEYYSTGTNEEVFSRFIKKTIVTRWGDESERDSFDRALAGEN